ncbi:MAG: C4-dicarboxylate ABC transporter substrate-binding protein, partial [Thermoprotei archaeon]
MPKPTVKTELTVFTGGTGGVYFPLGSKYAELLNKYAGDVITASARTSGASVANARALAEGKANV